MHRYYFHFIIVSTDQDFVAFQYKLDCKCCVPFRPFSSFFRLSAQSKFRRREGAFKIQTSTFQFSSMNFAQIMHRKYLRLLKLLHP